MQGTQALDEFFEPIMNLVMDRLTSEPMATHLKRHLLCVYLTAMVYNPTFTI